MGQLTSRLDRTGHWTSPIHGLPCGSITDKDWDLLNPGSSQPFDLSIPGRFSNSTPMSGTYSNLLSLQTGPETGKVPWQRLGDAVMVPLHSPACIHTLKGSYRTYSRDTAAWMRRYGLALNWLAIWSSSPDLINKETEVQRNYLS